MKQVKNEDIRENIIYYLLMIQIIWLFILPAMDGKMNMAKVINYGGFAVLSLSIVLIFARRFAIERKIEESLSFWMVIAFFLICGISCVWALRRGIAFADVIRGLLPFVWFIYIIVTVQSLDYRQMGKIVRLIGVMSVAYAIRIFAYYIAYVAGNSQQRVTFYLVKSTSVIPMIGTLIFLFLFIKDGKWKYYAAAIGCFVSVILTETKSMFLAVIFGLMIMGILLLCLLKESGKKKLLIGYMSLLMMGVITICGTDLGDRWRNMIAIEDSGKLEEPLPIEEKNLSTDKHVVVVDTGSVSVRMIEYRTAIEKFLDSPILGQGLGYRWEAEGLDYGGPVIYMHNIVAFTMMDFGMVGLFYLVAVAVIIIRKTWGFLRQSDIDKNRKADYILYFSVIVMSFVYANFFAVFRNI